jgi:hypothetical protein
VLKDHSKTISRRSESCLERSVDMGHLPGRCPYFFHQVYTSINTVYHQLSMFYVKGTHPVTYAIFSDYCTQAPYISITQRNSYTVMYLVTIKFMAVYQK